MGQLFGVGVEPGRNMVNGMEWDHSRGRGTSTPCPGLLTGWMDEHLRQFGILNRICGNGESVGSNQARFHGKAREVKELTLDVAMGSKEA